MWFLLNIFYDYEHKDNTLTSQSQVFWLINNGRKREKCIFVIKILKECYYLI